jgi:Spy/CpxP family protein refolding chaperone
MTHKKIFRVLALAAFVAMVAISTLQAAPDCQKKGDHEKMMGEGCMMMCNQLPNLSAEQKVMLEKLCAEHQKLMAAAKADIEKQTLEMKAMMKDPVDVKKVEAEIDEIAKRKADMQKKCLAHRLAVRALLTDEQKVKFDEMGCGMMGGKCGMKGHGMKMEKGKCPKAEAEKK